jgi:hypothetical protein
MNVMITAEDVVGRSGGRLWLACGEPERPPDAYVVWHAYGQPCAPCRVKAEALRRQYPDDPHVHWLHDVVGTP